MSSLTQIRTAIQTTLEDELLEMTVYAKVADAVNPPCVVVVPAEADFYQAMGRGLDQWNFDLLVLVPTADLENAQYELDDYVSGAGVMSIRQVIFANRNLGLSDTECSVAGMTNYGIRYQAAAISHVGATLRLVVYTKGTA